jgi:polyphosphate kinase
MNAEFSDYTELKRFLDGRTGDGTGGPAELGERSRFINRELSWLEFNDRVLEEARDAENPLAERMNFLSITSSNLDEFFMIRVASLQDQVHAGYKIPDPAGLTPSEQLAAMSERTHVLVRRQYSTYTRALLPALLAEGVRILKRNELDESQLARVRHYFDEEVFPVLTPIGVDAGRPFPLIANQTINLIVLLVPPVGAKSLIKKYKKKDTSDRYAIVQIPSVLPRLIRLDDGGKGGRDYILLEDVVRLNLESLFPGMGHDIVSCFRIMRNADLDIDEEDAADLLVEIESQLKQRQWGEVIRLELERGADPVIREILKKNLGIEERNIYDINGPLDLTFASKLLRGMDNPDLYYRPFKPQKSPDLSDAADIFSVIRQKDVILHHPYESFDPVIRLIREAAEDEQVLAIKQTLYRVSGTSPIVASLAQAAENGKQVFVLVELKARFDEESNIHWAKRLEQAGCHVVYGLMGLKTHSKITLIVRREDDGIRRYVHLGTGNYNDQTAKLYTDLAMLTTVEAFGRDATDFFNMISGYSLPLSFRKVVPAPRWLRKDTIRRIEREKDHALAGRPAAIVAKINSLVDPGIIDKLYEASCAGVSIDLIVRGICCLRPGIKNLSENIRVRSLVGRFLEHPRIFYYFNDGSEDLFLSSADWMPRNLDRRIELLFPIESPEARARIFRVLDLQLRDTDRARLMLHTGNYIRVDRRRHEQLDSQVALMEDAIEAANEKKQVPAVLDRYIPRTAPEASEDELY